ncbi:MAG: hypothetical protein WKF84_04650 [Pyrinomonadaceae bacterium]
MKTTESNVVVFNTELLWLVTDSPTYIVLAILIVSEPMSVQLEPSFE